MIMFNVIFYASISALTDLRGESQLILKVFIYSMKGRDISYLIYASSDTLNIALFASNIF